MIIKVIAQNLMLDEKYLENLPSKNHQYKRYEVPKKNGTGTRIIKHPSKELKTIQYWLNSNIFGRIPVSPVATAYETGCSIAKNASIHKNNRHILHLDIQDFFPSISRQHVEQLLNKYSHSLSIDDEDICYILDVALYLGKEVTIGSVSAPLIANRVLFEFDNDLSEYLQKQPQKLVYSRYADDIIISSNNRIDDKIIIAVEKMLAKYKFSLNKEKSYFMYNGSRRQITGIVIDNNNDDLSIGTKRMRKIKRDLYHYFVKCNCDNPEEEYEMRQKLLGELAFVKSVSSRQYDNLKKSYSKYESQKRRLF